MYFWPGFFHLFGKKSRIISFFMEIIHKNKGNGFVHYYEK